MTTSVRLLSPIAGLLAAAAVAFATPAVAPALATTAATTTAPTPVALGVNVAGDDNATALASYTSVAGRNPAIVMWYTSWAGPLAYSPQLPWADGVGATPMITWDPVGASGAGISLSSIASGGYDAYLDTSAALARTYGKPLLIRFAHEMNLAGSPYGPGHAGETPEAFRLAWQHIVLRFQADRATNVRWVWSPNVDCNGGCPFDDYFPGDGYVDYVGLDGYNFSAVHNIAWMSFTQVFARSYADLTALSSKPVMIAETASAEAGGSKSAWITSVFQTEIPQSFPRVVAVVWFDRVKETDWRVDSSSASLAAWQQVVGDPRYQGRLFASVAP